MTRTDTSKTIYADDLFNIIIVHGLDQKCIEQLMDASNNILTDNIRRVKTDLGSLAADIPDDILAIMAEADSFDAAVLNAK